MNWIKQNWDYLAIAWLAWLAGLMTYNLILLIVLHVVL